MFGELSRLFDRNFAVGFFLPAGILFLLTAILLNLFVFNIDIANFQETDWLVLTTVLGISSLVGGIVFLAGNRDLYRIMEGYGTYNPMKLYGWIEKRRFRNTLEEYGELEQEFQDCMEAGKEFPLKYQQRRIGLAIRLAEEFPDKEEFLLPTPFGNVLRSFECFPRVMYGLDSIVAWGRLLAVIPKEYIEILDSARAHVDFWVNLGLVFILIQIEYIGIVFSTASQLNWCLLGLLIALSIIAPFRATSSAREWGAVVKSAFDVFAPRLREALGFDQPENRREEFAQWENFSRAVAFRLRDHLPELKNVKKTKPAGRNKN